ncbi:MAG: carbonic anhydrase [Actinomycetota bacterium]|nr:carbonic anhydrase [Actinomycetota bacterium]
MGQDTYDLLRNNASYAQSFAKGDLPAAPARRLAVVACMDARIDVHRILGLQEGDAHVIRNAGGVLTEDVIRSLVISQRLLGTDKVFLVHHTECGLLDLSEDELKSEIEQEVGERPGFDFHAFSDLEDNMRTTIAQVASHPFLSPTDEVRGFIFDVRTGRLEEVT